MMLSSCDSIPVEAWTYLKQHCYHTTNPKAAYSILVSLAEHNNHDQTGQMVLDRLKSVLEDPYTDNPRRKKFEV